MPAPGPPGTPEVRHLATDPGGPVAHFCPPHPRGARAQRSHRGEHSMVPRERSRRYRTCPCQRAWSARLLASSGRPVRRTQRSRTRASGPQRPAGALSAPREVVRRSAADEICHCRGSERRNRAPAPESPVTRRKPVDRPAPEPTDQATKPSSHFETTERLRHEELPWSTRWGSAAAEWIRRVRGGRSGERRSRDATSAGDGVRAAGPVPSGVGAVSAFGCRRPTPVARPARDSTCRHRCSSTAQADPRGGASNRRSRHGGRVPVSSIGHRGRLMPSTQRET
jgi:hypothetical protein